ncbi:hypothetical protein SOVF_057300 [Spinacia oleracea]|nr:hypothetical protein SOVF_057300 [Spinacia oleracea]
MALFADGYAAIGDFSLISADNATVDAPPAPPSGTTVVIPPGPPAAVPPVGVNYVPSPPSLGMSKDTLTALVVEIGLGGFV